MAQERPAKMLAAERRRRIVEMLQSSSPILISDMARELGVSTVTVRGDFDALAARGLLRRVHGGAGLVSDHETILVGSGSTTFELVHALASRPESSDITVVTNDWAILDRGSKEFGNLRLAGTGGTLSREHGFFYGHLLASSLSDILFDKVFIGADGYDPGFGFLTDLAAVSEAKKVFLAHARTKVVLMDSSKICDGRSYTRFAKPGDVDMVFIDRDPGGAIAESTPARVVECCV